MEIKVERLTGLCSYPTGGGMRTVQAEIIIDGDQPKRIQRHALIYETLGACLDFLFTHEQIDDLTDTLVDALDQLEPIGD